MTSTEHTPVAILDLHLGEQRWLTVEATMWDSEKRCIVIGYNGVLDARTPALTATEARELAAALTRAADQLNPLQVVR